MPNHEKKIDTDALFRDIVESTSGSFDVSKIRKKIVDTVGKALGADRCFIMEYDKIHDRFIESKEEYLSSSDWPSYIGIDLNEKIPHFVSELKKGKQLVFNATKAQIGDESIDLNSDFFNRERDEIEEYKVYSAIVTPLFYLKEFLGDLVLHYVDKNHEVLDGEIDVLDTVKKQISIILYQAILFDEMKKKTERESFLKRITEKTVSSLDIDELLAFICKESASIFDVQRCAIASFIDNSNDKRFVIRSEYKSSPELQGFNNTDLFLNAANYLTLSIQENEIIAIGNVETADAPEYFKTVYNEMGIKSLIGISIQKGDRRWGVLVLSEYNRLRKWNEDDKTLLSTIRDQVYLAISQAELYQNIQNTANYERILRDIMLSFVKTLEMKELVKNIVTQVGQLLIADRCFFVGSNPKTFSNYPIEGFAEYLSSSEIASHTSRIPLPEETSFFVKASQQQRVIYANDITKEELPEATRKFLFEDLSVKSYLIAPVYYGDIRYGAIVLHYVKEFKEFSQEDIDIMIAIANQAAIVIHQSELFEQQKKATEREIMNRNIIEILRSSIDKDIIKRLFVKNIAKFFAAERVLFSEYDEKEKKYLPSDENSEYLSNPQFKSLVGFDWASLEVYDFIKPLLEKRELLITDFNQYLQFEPVSEGFKKMFEEYNIKSSYNFPVMYQQTLVGFFCLDYMSDVKILSDEDISRIRNICAQAGIAFYHAHLYEQIHSSARQQSSFIMKTSNECASSLAEIVEISEKLLNSDFEKELFIYSITELNKISKETLDKVEACRRHFD